MASTSTSVVNPPSVHEYSIRVPKDIPKKYHVMRFNGNLDVDFSKWTKVSMARENNMREFKATEEEQPKFGAGSEFGREAKEEARRKKLGIVARKYKADNQPWILKSFESTVKKFKGIREGGVSNNTAYYVFTHAEDGFIEAFPLDEWHKFQPIQRYKALSAEEAEMEYSKRDKNLNYFSLMLKKRLKGAEDIGLDEDEEKGKKTSTKKVKELKISEMDEWMESSNDDSSEEEDNDKKEVDKSDIEEKTKKPQPKKEKAEKKNYDEEALEDSDDGDEEGRELDYISDSSDSQPENMKLEGVSEEKALRKLLNSDDEFDEDSDKSDKEQSDEDKPKDKNEDKKAGIVNKKAKKNKTKVKTEINKGSKDDDSIFSSDSSTDEESKKGISEMRAKKYNKEKGEKKPNSAKISTSAPPTNSKRKLIDDALAEPISKKAMLDLPSFPSVSNECGITEDAVRKYLIRKPMTTSELFQKFKSKRAGLSGEQLVILITQILKRINPVKQTLNGKLYLSIKS